MSKTMESSDRSPWVKKAAIAAAVSAGAAALYLAYSRRNRPSSSSSNGNAGSGPLSTTAELKAFGNTLFSAMKYEQAIDAFTKAIELEEEGSDVTKAMCYQNRAATKERLGTFTTENIMSDVEEALRLNPSYAKAYLRLAKLNQKDNKYHEALVDLFCAIHLDNALDEQAGKILPGIMEMGEKEIAEEWKKQFVSGQKKPVRHEKVYAWLFKTVKNDYLRNLVVSYDISKEAVSIFDKAVKAIHEKQYEYVASVAEKEDINSSTRLEALLLAARFHGYQNKLDQAKEMLLLFDREFEGLPEDEKESKKALSASRHILQIESGRNKEEVMRAYYEAIASDLNNGDFYAMAAFRLVACEDMVEALKILHTEGIEKDNSNISLLRYTLDIMNSVEGDPSVLHGAILKLDQFVQELVPSTPYSCCLLAKVYATFGNGDEARRMVQKAIDAEPQQSLHWYDRSCMAVDGPDAIRHLERCLECEPHHAEANLMTVSLKMNEFGPRLLKQSELDDLMTYVDRAMAVMDPSSPADFPVVQGLFRMQAVLDAKRDAAKRLGLL